MHYLASVYKDVYVDFGAAFLIASRHGQCSVVGAVAAINKLMWSAEPWCVSTGGPVPGGS